MSPLVQDLIYMAGIVLLPLIPASLLFRVLPRASADGISTADLSSQEVAPDSGPPPYPSAASSQEAVPDSEPPPHRSAASAQGLVGPLKVKLGGSFAAYFVLFTVLLTAFEKPPHVDIYRLSGRLVLGADTSANPILWKDHVQISLEPRRWDVDSDGSFYVDFPYHPGNKDVRNTKVHLEAGICGTARVYLGQEPTRIGVRPYRLHFGKDHQISVLEPVVLIPTDSSAFRCTRRQGAP